MIMRVLASSALLLVFLATAVKANTEKVIFIAPPLSTFLEPLINTNEAIANVLSHETSSVRSSLPVAFPTSETPRGLEYWHLLRQLNPRQRYEVRVCWSASQPTEFWLNVFGPDDIDHIPKRIQNAFASASGQERASSQQANESVLLLRIQAAADFYSSNQTLMQYPPSVDVDIILDPYLLNVFPASLVPTGVYITTLAVVGYFVSGVIWRYLISNGPTEKLRME